VLRDGWGAAGREKGDFIMTATLVPFVPAVRCFSCGYRGKAEPTPEYLARAGGPEWVPGDYYHAFGACPECKDDGLIWDDEVDLREAAP
jgi:Zn ribbon nucleic-acid-binding protein